MKCKIVKDYFAVPPMSYMQKRHHLERVASFINCIFQNTVPFLSIHAHIYSAGGHYHLFTYSAILLLIQS